MDEIDLVEVLWMLLEYAVGAVVFGALHGYAAALGERYARRDDTPDDGGAADEQVSRIVEKIDEITARLDTLESKRRKR